MIKEYGIAISLAMLGGVVRNIFAGEIKRKEFIRTTIGSGLIGLLAFWLAPYLHTDQHVQYAIIYMFGMLSPQIVKISSNLLPKIIDKYFDTKVL